MQDIKLEEDISKINHEDGEGGTLLRVVGEGGFGVSPPGSISR